MSDDLNARAPVELSRAQAMWLLGAINNVLVPQGVYPLSADEAKRINDSILALDDEEHAKLLIAAMQRLRAAAFPTPVSGPDPRD